MVILKRLDHALEAGDAIRAVIRGTAVGQDGRTKSITLPNPVAQQQLIKSAYQTAKLDPCETTYVEAHGTGTLAGDFAEIEAIERIFNPKRTGKPLYIGSVKANIGHLESVSGIAGLIKAVMVLEKGLIPPLADFQVPKMRLQLENRKIKVPTPPVTLWHVPLIIVRSQTK